MKRFAIIGMLVLSIFLIKGSASAAEKFSYVDLVQVFDGYNKTKEYDKVLEGEQKVYEENREKKLGEVKELQEKLSLLSEEEREARKNELQDNITKLQEFDRNSTQDLRKKRDEKVQEIFQDISKAIEDYAKKEGITFVFDKRALIYQSKNLDITDQILKVLNKK